MYKPLKPVILLVLICFISTYVLPVPAKAEEKARDNDHVTYQLDTHGDINTDTKFTLSISARYDGIPMTDISFKELKGFQLIKDRSNGEYDMQAPPDGNKQYSLMMEGTANGQRNVFTVPVYVKNVVQSSDTANTIMMWNTVLIVASVLLVIAMVSLVSSTKGNLQ